MADDLIPIPNGLAQLPTSKQCGIYFLWDGGIVVYVGQSHDLTQRVCQHIQEGVKRFSAASFIFCRPHELDKLERHYIEKMAPKYNQCRLAKFIRMACADKLETVPQPYGLLNSAKAAEFLGMEVDAFMALRARGIGPPRKRRHRHRGCGYHTEELRQWAVQHPKLPPA